jgi:hypothetical protein
VQKPLLALISAASELKKFHDKSLFWQKAGNEKPVSASAKSSLKSLGARWQAILGKLTSKNRLD